MRQNVFRALLPLLVLPLFVACPFQQEKDDSDQANALMMLAAMPEQMEQMELNGSYKDGPDSAYWAAHIISASKTPAGGVSGYWIEDPTANGGDKVTATVIEFSNAMRMAYVRTGAPTWCTGQGTSYPNCECYTAGTCFNRNLWTKYNGSFYICQSVYNKPTLDAAKSATGSAVNSADPTASGSCGSFPWTKLIAQ